MRCFTRGAWLWQAEGDGQDDPRVAFFLRDFPQLRRDGSARTEDLPADEARVLESWSARAPVSRPTWRAPRASSRRESAARCRA